MKMRKFAALALLAFVIIAGSACSDEQDQLTPLYELEEAQATGDGDEDEKNKPE